VRALFFLVVWSFGSAAWGQGVDDAGIRKVSIKVGAFARLDIRAATGVCDDPAIIRVEDGGDHLRLVGLKAGKTMCGFAGPSGMDRKQYDVVVTP